MGRARGANALMNFATETSYGTPPVSGYKRMPFVSSALGAEQGLIDSDLLGLGRNPADPTYDVVTNDGDVVVPLDSVALGHWLRLLFGPPTTAAAADQFAHTFTSGAQDLPSASIEIAHPDRPSYSTNYGVRANTLMIQMQRSGLASATIGLIAKGETVLANTSSAGTVEQLANSRRFAQATGYISVDGVQLGEVLSARLSYSNTMEKDETIRPDGEIQDVDPGMPSLSIALTTKFADTTLMNKATGKSPAAISLAWVMATGESLLIGGQRLFLTRSKRPITGPGGIQVEMTAMGASAGAAGLFGAVLTNGVTSYA